MEKEKLDGLSKKEQEIHQASELLSYQKQGLKDQTVSGTFFDLRKN